jgi:hypothetical protein
MSMPTERENFIMKKLLKRIIWTFIVKQPDTPFGSARLQFLQLHQKGSSDPR